MSELLHRSFTLSFPDTAYDEGLRAWAVAQRTGAQHTDVPLQGADMLVRLEEAVAALDQPTMDGINTYFVSWAARQVGLKVALSGLGGDELFAGYQSFADTPKLARMDAIARFVAGASVVSALLWWAPHRTPGRPTMPLAHQRLAHAGRAPSSLFLHAAPVSPLRIGAAL